MKRRIKLLQDIPVAAKYGLTAGREMCAELVPGGGRTRHFWVEVLGEKIKLWSYEVEDLGTCEEEA